MGDFVGEYPILDCITLVGNGSNDIDVRKPRPAPKQISADSAHIPNRRERSARGAEAYINEPLISAGIDEIANATIGHGRRITPLPDKEGLGLTDEQYTKFVSDYVKLWNADMYSKRRWIDQRGECDIAEMQRNVLTTVLSRGEAYTLGYWFENPVRPFRTALALIDDDRIRTPDDLPDSDRENVIAGHRITETGFTRSYFVHEYHRNDGRNSNFPDKNYTEVRRYNEFGREQVIHTYMKKCPELTRGISHLTSAFKKIDCFKNYTEVRMEAAIMQLAMAFVIKSNDKNALGQIMGQNMMAFDETAVKEAYGEMLERATMSQMYHNQNGIDLDGAKAIRLLDGEEAQILTGSEASMNDKQFVDECHTEMARSFGSTKSNLTQNFEASYSAARAEMISFYRTCENYANYIVNDWLQSVTTMWLEDVIQSGRLSVPNYPDPNLAWLHFAANRELYCNANFHGPARDEIDQAKTMAYWEKRKQAGVFNYEEFYNSKGMDWRQAISQQFEELKFIDNMISNCEFQNISDPLSFIMPDLQQTNQRLEDG